MGERETPLAYSEQNPRMTNMQGTIQHEELSKMPFALPLRSLRWLLSSWQCYSGHVTSLSISFPHL